MAPLSLSRRHLLAAAGAAMLTSPSYGQAVWAPTQPIELQLGFGPGGTVDNLARQIGTELNKRAGWTVAVMNKPGAGGSVMLRSLRQAKPDGHALALSVSPEIVFSPLSIQPQPYTHEDFSYVAALSFGQIAMVSKAGGEFTDLASIRAVAQRKGHVTIGTSDPLFGVAAQQIGKELGVAVTVVPFKGGAETMQQMLGGHVDLGMSGGTHIPLQKAGQVSVVAGLGSRRLVANPEVRTLREQGVPMSIDSLFQIVGPKGMPDAALRTISGHIRSILEDAEFARTLDARLGLVPSYMPPNELARFMASEAAESVRLFRASKAA
jgi:tripartite-type tricarboxylate transporter receptor subunit TctC